MYAVLNFIVCLLLQIFVYWQEFNFQKAQKKYGRLRPNFIRNWITSC